MISLASKGRKGLIIHNLMFFTGQRQAASKGILVLA